MPELLPIKPYKPGIKCSEPDIPLPVFCYLVNDFASQSLLLIIVHHLAIIIYGNPFSICSKPCSVPAVDEYIVDIISADAADGCEFFNLQRNIDVAVFVRKLTPYRTFKACDPYLVFFPGNGQNAGC